MFELDDAVLAACFEEFAGSGALEKQAGVRGRLLSQVARRAAGPMQSMSAGLQRFGQAAARFGKRQGYALTGLGAKGPGGARALGAGAAPALERVSKAVPNTKEWASAQKHLAAAKKMEQLGATNVPGYLKSLAKNPLQTVRTGAQEAWHGTGTGASGALGKAMTFGLPVAALGGELVSGSQDPEQGTFERAGRAAGSMAYGLSSMPFAGAMLLGEGAIRGAGALGKGVDKLRGKKPKKKLQGAAGLANPALAPADDDNAAHGVEYAEAPRGVAPFGDVT